MGNLCIRNLGKTYSKGVRVLSDINIAIESGEFLVLVGPSGCGKSTLLSMIAGLEDVTEGEILIDNKVVNDLEPADRNIAMVFQSYALYPTMTVAGNISFGLEMRGVPKPQRNQAVEQVASLLQIQHLLDRRPSQLSGGQRQRVAMGRALVRNPSLFLFDEPLSNLDAKLRIEMRTEIKRLHKRTGTTIVYVTHDQVEAMTMATRICVLQGGVVQQQGTPDEIYTNPTNAFVAGFMGSPPMNLITARASIREKLIQLTVATPSKEQGISLIFPKDLPGVRDGAEVILGLRPEHIVEEVPVDSSPREYQQVICDLELVEPTGMDTFGITLLGGKEVTCRLKTRSVLATNTPVPLYFGMIHACAFDASTGVRIDRA